MLTEALRIYDRLAKVQAKDAFHNHTIRFRYLVEKGEINM